MLQVMKRFITPVYRLFTHNLKMFVKNSNNPVFGFFFHRIKILKIIIFKKYICEKKLSYERCYSFDATEVMIFFALYY